VSHLRGSADGTRESVPDSPFRSNVTDGEVGQTWTVGCLTRDEMCSRMFEKLLAASWFSL